MHVDGDRGLDRRSLCDDVVVSHPRFLQHVHVDGLQLEVDEQGQEVDMPEGNGPT